MNNRDLLEGAWDLHLHAGPDVIPRIQNADEVLADAAAAGMAGIGLKDHCGSTAALAKVLEKPGGPRVIGSLTLNPPAGGLNPYAVETAFRQGARILWFPTYSTQRHLDILGPSPFPMPEGQGLTLLDPAGALLPEVLEILKLVAEHDGILSTGHLHPEESVALFRKAKNLGVKRMVLTHATLNVTAMDLDLQREVVSLGAWVEHCMLSLTERCRSLAEEEMVGQILELGPEHCFLTSDLGSVDNGPVVAGFADWLERLAQAGCPEEALRQMITANPEKLLFG